MTASAAATAEIDRPRPATASSGEQGSATAANDAVAFNRALTDAAVTPNAPQPQVQQASAQQEAPPAEAAPEAEAAPDEARRREIEQWVETDSDHSGGFLGFGGTNSNDKVVDALSGNSRLGALDRPEQAYLVDRMLDRWAAGRGDGPGGAYNLATNLGDAPELRGVVAERFALRAGEMSRAVASQKPDESWRERAQANALADSAVTALSGPAYDEPQDLAPLRTMVGGLPPQAAGDFARALATAPNAPAMMGSHMLSRTLQALNEGPQTEATSAFVQNAFAAASLGDYGPMAGGGLPQQLGRALAREWYPDDTVQQNAEAGRLTDILNTGQGRTLLAANETIPLEARVNALARIRMDRSITADTLRQTDDPWTNPAIVRPEAQAIAQQFLTSRGDAAQRLAGTDLDNTVGFAMGFPPTLPEGTSPAEAEASLARGEFSYYASGDHAAAVRAVTDQIRAVGGDAPNVTVLPVLYSSGESGPVQLPLFRVTDASGTERFVDNTGRRYENFQDWREHNKLPPGHMTYPEDGHLATDANGAVRLGEGNTPETVDTFGEHVTSILDTAALVGGIVAGGVLIVGSGGLATPIVVGAGAVAVGAGAWGAYRSGSELADRSQHGQSINPLQDGEARNLWLNLGASALSVGAFGSAARLAQLSRAGRAIAPLEASAHGYVQAGAAIADTAAITNQGIDLARNWNEMSGGERATALLSMGFWATATIAGARATGSRPGDMFNPAVIRDNLLPARRFPVEADTPGLSPGEIRAAYDLQDGRVTNIRIQTGAGEVNPRQLQLHMQLADRLQRADGLSARLGALLSDRPDPPVGSSAWEARLEIGKISREARTLADEAASARTPAELERIATRQRELDQALIRETRRLDAAAVDGQGFIASPRSLNELLAGYAASGDIVRGVPANLAALEAPAATARRRVDYGSVNAAGQAQGIDATITRAMLDTGSTADSSIRPPGFAGGAQNHSRGHLLARMLGGSGSEERNLVTLFQQDTNSPVMSDFERHVYLAVDAGEVVNYRVTPIYEEGSLIPTSVALQARGSDGLDISVTIVNRDGS